MTPEIGFLWLAEIIMTVALGCFFAAFRVRKTDRARHMLLGKTGAYLVFAGLLALEFVVRVLGWHLPRRSEFLFHCHLVTASLSFALLLALLVTGVQRRRALHVYLYIPFLPLFTAAVVLSWFAFQLW